MAAPSNTHRLLAEDLLALPGASLRRMFGCEAVYLDGVILLVLADKEQPWNGLLFPTERERHAAILAEFRFLVPHEVLPKWLYLSADQDRFESLAEPLLLCLLQRDERFGVLPKPKKKKASKAKPGSKKITAHRSPPDDGRPPHLH